jgi:hypothetical protein
MSDTKEAIAGLVAVALPLWVRAQDDNDRELRNNRLDLRDLEDQLRACCNHGANIRNKLPVNQDFGVGLALSNPKAAVPELIPTTSSVTRPAIGDDATLDYKWPPRTGTYTANGAVSEIGEITRLALALSVPRKPRVDRGLHAVERAQPDGARADFLGGAGAVDGACGTIAFPRRLRDSLVQDARRLGSWHAAHDYQRPDRQRHRLRGCNQRTCLQQPSHATPRHCWRRQLCCQHRCRDGRLFAAFLNGACGGWRQQCRPESAVHRRQSFTFQLRNGWTNGSTVDVSLLVGV